MILKRMLWAEWEIGLSVSLEAKGKPLSQVQILGPDRSGGIVDLADDGKQDGTWATTRDGI